MFHTAAHKNTARPAGQVVTPAVPPALRRPVTTLTQEPCRFGANLGRVAYASLSRLNHSL